MLLLRYFYFSLYKITVLELHVNYNLINFASYYFHTIRSYFLCRAPRGAPCFLNLSSWNCRSSSFVVCQPSLSATHGPKAEFISGIVFFGLSFLLYLLVFVNYLAVWNIFIVPVQKGDMALSIMCYCLRVCTKNSYQW